MGIVDHCVEEESETETWFGGARYTHYWNDERDWAHFWCGYWFLGDDWVEIGLDTRQVDEEKQDSLEIINLRVGVREEEEWLQILPLREGGEAAIIVDEAMWEEAILS